MNTGFVAVMDQCRRATHGQRMGQRVVWISGQAQPRLDACRHFIAEINEPAAYERQAWHPITECRTGSTVQPIKKTGGIRQMVDFDRLAGLSQQDVIA